MFEVRTLT